MHDIVLYATDSMADWEYGYVTAGITQACAGGAPYRLVVAADNSSEVTTAGGLHIRPDSNLEDIDPNAVAILVLPGGYTWGEGHDKVLALAESLVSKNTPVAAICGATLGLARAGLLDDRRHTSNAPGFLSAIQQYHGDEHYVDSRVVNDQKVITAPGSAPVDFARAVFEELSLFSEDFISAWYRLYSGGGGREFNDYMAAATAGAD